jgi:hypothetical protein
MEDLQLYMQGKEVNVLIVLQTYNYIDNWEEKNVKNTIENARLFFLFESD